MTTLCPKLPVLALLASVLAVSALCAHGQNGSDATPLLLPALARFDLAKKSTTRFTYLYLDHTQNFNAKGKRTVEYRHLYEVIYIADLEYEKLLEMNGKPLKGKALKEEEDRYDQAVRERAALDQAARSKIEHQEVKHFDVNLKYLATKYRNTVTGLVKLEGRECSLIDSIPLERATDAPKKRLRIWLDAAQGQILRIEFETLADEEGVLGGATGNQSFTYIDGIPVVTQNHIDFNMLLGGKTPIRVVADHTFTNYRRFVSTLRIVPDPPAEDQRE